MYELVEEASQVLRKPPPIFDFDNPPEDPKEIASKMSEAMDKFGGLGLSANQCGLPYRMFVMRTMREGDEETTVESYFNPELVRVSQETDMMKEGCLSFPDIYLMIRRSKTIELKYQDADGETHQIMLEGLGARCVQHEMDHLNGIIFLQRASRLKIERALKARKKHGDGSGDAAEEGGQESYVHHKQQQHQQYGMPAPRAQEDSDGPGSVINKAADYLAMRRRREAERATTEANKKDLESAPNRRAENFSNEDDLDIENRNFQNSSVMVSSKSQPNLEVLEEDFDGEGNDFHGMMKDNAGGIARQSPGSNRKTKFPPLN